MVQAGISGRSSQTSAFEANLYYSSGDGSGIEGAIAAFLWDLVDGANETHDVTEYPLKYVLSIVDTCKRNGFFGGWMSNFTVANNVYCFEKTVDTWVRANFFPTDYQTAQQESATEPGSWSQMDIRAVWLMNLYGQ